MWGCPEPPDLKLVLCCVTPGRKQAAGRNTCSIPSENDNCRKAVSLTRRGRAEGSPSDRRPQGLHVEGEACVPLLFLFGGTVRKRRWAHQDP